MSGETIRVLGTETWDEYGGLDLEDNARTITGCVVSPVGQTDISTDAVWGGDDTTLQVLAPAGTVIAEGETVILADRNTADQWTVKHVPFDWSIGRRPALARHRPRVVFIIERKEA